MQINDDSILLGSTLKKIAGNPNLVASLPGSLCEDLIFPLPHHYLRVDTLDVDARLETKVKVLVNKVATKGIGRPNGSIVRTLRSRKTVLGETEREIGVGINEGVLLLVAEPEIIIVLFDRGSSVRFMGRPVGI